jgi:hypothetical protein
MSNISKIIAQWPAALRDTDCANNADAISETFATMAGRNRWFHEALTGEFDGSEQPLSPKNPQGTVGIDNSGPPYGPALRHSFSQLAGGISKNESVVFDLSGGNFTVLNVARRGYELTDIPSIQMMPCWVKPFSPTSKAPHSRCTLDLFISNEKTSSVEVYVSILAGSGPVIELYTTGSPLVIPAASSFSSANVLVQNALPAQQVVTHSGHNTVQIKLWSDQSADVWLCGASVSMYSKRSIDDAI